jgi:uncharacterized membrane protein (UPF0127 family)
MIAIVRRLATVLLIALAAIGLAAPSIAIAQTVASDAPPWLQPVPTPPQQATITVGSTKLDVQIANTPFLQELGLGYRNGLDDGTGMLFINNQPAPQSYWMKGMRFCLDIVWVEKGEIVGAAESVCPDPAGTPDAARAIYRSPEPVSDILEVPAGWLKANGYGKGTKVEIPTSVQPAQP